MKQNVYDIFLEQNGNKTGIISSNNLHERNLDELTENNDFKRHAIIHEVPMLIKG